MNAAASGDPIESVLLAIGARLPGPAGLRDDIIAELRDGLLETAEANERMGLGRGEAVRLALRQFGDASILAASFWPEMAAARARRMVLALFATGPIVAALWASAARSRGPGSESGLFDGGQAHLAAALLVAAAVGCGIWTIVATGRVVRRPHIAPHMLLLGAAATGGIAVIADVAVLSMLAVPLAGFPGAIHQMALTAAVLATGTRLVLTSRASWSCLAMRTSRRPNLPIR
jgi:hypothetical protein